MTWELHDVRAPSRFALRIRSASNRLFLHYWQLDARTYRGGSRADYLRHVDGTDELKWKREGAACIESDTEDQPVDGVMSLKDLTDEQEELERCKHFLKLAVSNSQQQLAIHCNVVSAYLYSGSALPHFSSAAYAAFPKF